MQPFAESHPRFTQVPHVHVGCGQVRSLGHFVVDAQPPGEQVRVEFLQPLVAHPCGTQLEQEHEPPPPPPPPPPPVPMPPAAQAVQTAKSDCSVSGAWRSLGRGIGSEHPP